MKRAIAAVLAAVFVTEAVPARAQGGGWPAVRCIAPGTEIIIQTTETAPATRQFISADDSSVVVVNLADGNLPPSVNKVLRGLLAVHPDYFTPARARDTFLLEKGVRIAPEGVFHDSDKIADRSAIVETIARPSVVSLRTAAVKRNPVDCSFAGYGGWVLGGFAGAMAGVGIAHGLGADSDAAGMTALFGGMVVGGTGGASWAYRKCRNKPERMIYTARQ